MNGNKNGVEGVSIKIAKKFVSCYADRIVVLKDGKVKNLLFY
ncbi:hypothetical protein bthur0005_3720 [Bacillus thuringiensis serovar pakistani str. T13001]|nr:hypothetical protein bthur0005_3720 [Bacillus thuringiensis serovar pakistani str. T13001]